MDRARIEEPADSNREDQAAVERVIDPCGERGARAIERAREENASDDAERDGEPVVKDDVGVSEGDGAGSDHGGTGGKEAGVAVEDECAPDDLLRIDAHEGVEDHDDEPQRGAFARHGEENRGAAHARVVDGDGDREERAQDGERGEEPREVVAHSPELPERASVERRVQQKDGEGVEAEGPERWEEEAGLGDEVEVRERSGEVKEQVLDREEGAWEVRSASP